MKKMKNHPSENLTSFDKKLEKVPENPDELNIDGMDDSHDPFAEAYLNTLNESLDNLSPEKIRDKSTEILANPRGLNLGLNASVFSSTTGGVLDTVHPKNGVKLRSKATEVGNGRYVNENKSKMSLFDYKSLVSLNQGSLANISIRGQKEEMPSLLTESVQDPFKKKFLNM
jgi:hypothetical protein